MINGPERREPLHDVAPSAERSHRHAAADDLAERGEIGPHAVQGLGAAERNAKTGHHFVEYQHRARAVALLAQALKEAGSGWNAVHIAGHRFNDDAGDLIADLAESLAHSGGVVVVEGHGMGANAVGTPGEVGTPRVSAPEPALINSESECP